MADRKLPLIYCAIDTPDLDHAKALAAAMQKAECGVKFGLEFFNAHGPGAIREIKDSYPDVSVFIDLKYHDIPNTVAGAIRSITPVAPDFINVHASGGLTMMQQAQQTLRDEADKIGVTPAKLLGVTILTSLEDNDLSQIGYQPGMKDRVIQLAKLTRKAGLDGIVCSAREIETVRSECGDHFTLMVPGIRPEGSEAGDQRRVMTPAEAVRKGATHLVIGRPINAAQDPVGAASAILTGLRQRAA